MDWNKQTYLAVNEIKGSMGRSNASDRLVFKDKGYSGRYAFRFRSGKGQMGITVESQTPILMTVKLDGVIIRRDTSDFTDANSDIDRGEHSLQIDYDGGYGGSFVITLTAPSLMRTDIYRFSSYDEIGGKVYIKDSQDNLYSFLKSDGYPRLLSETASPISSISYDGGIKTASAYLESGLLKINDNGTVTALADNVESFVLLRALLSKYHYHLYYLRNKQIYIIEKTAEGFMPAEGIGREIVDEIAGEGGSVFFYKTEGRWNAKLEGVYQNVVTINRKILNSDCMPAYSDGTYYVNRGGCFLENDTFKPVANADAMFFVGNDGYMMWKGKINKFNKENIL